MERLLEIHFGNPAMQEEYKSLLENQTWDLVPLPLGRKLVRCRWVYRTKSAADGILVDTKPYSCQRLSAGAWH
jgi:hypothetical protein